MTDIRNDNVQDENDLASPSFEEIKQSALSTSINEVAPSLNAPPVTPENVKKIIMKLARFKYVSPAVAFAAISLLFLKGAANKTAPDKMFVEVLDEEGAGIRIYKQDLMSIYNDTTGNKFIRRLAEAMAIDICEFAERHKLDGDLAMRINIEALSQGKPELTQKERAWANSFCQNVPVLDTRASVNLRVLLNADYQSRFMAKRKKSQPVSPPVVIPPKKKGAGGGRGGGRGRSAA